MQKHKLLGLKKAQSKPQPPTVVLASPKSTEMTAMKNRSITLRADVMKYFTNSRTKRNKPAEAKQAVLSRTCLKELPTTNQPTKHKRNGSDCPSQQQQATTPKCQHRRLFNFEREMEEQKRLVAEASTSVERAERQFKNNSLKRLSFRKNLVAHSKIDLKQQQLSSSSFLGSPKPSTSKHYHGSVSHRMARSFLQGSSSKKKCQRVRLEI